MSHLVTVYFRPRHNESIDASVPERIAKRRAWRTLATRGVRYALGDDAFVVHRVTRGVITLRSLHRPNSYLIFSGDHRPDDSRWSVDG